QVGRLDRPLTRRLELHQQYPPPDDVPLLLHLGGQAVGVDTGAHVGQPDQAAERAEEVPGPHPTVGPCDDGHLGTPILARLPTLISSRRTSLHSPCWSGPTSTAPSTPARTASAMSCLDRANCSGLTSVSGPTVLLSTRLVPRSTMPPRSNSLGTRPPSAIAR